MNCRQMDKLYLNRNAEGAQNRRRQRVVNWWTNVRLLAVVTVVARRSLFTVVTSSISNINNGCLRRCKAE